MSKNTVMSKNIFDLTNRPKITTSIHKSNKLSKGGAKKSISNTSNTSSKPLFKFKSDSQPLKSTYNEADIKKLLEGYIEVPKDQWPLLQKNDHIRYQRADNNLFRRGGFIFSQLINAQTQQKMIQLIAKPFIPISNTNRVWTIIYDDIKTIWKKQRNQPVLDTSKPTSNNEDESESDSDVNEETHGGEEKSIQSQSSQASKPAQLSQNILPIQNQSAIIPPSIYTQIENIKVDIMRLSNEQKNIINLIKRLHNIK